MLKHVLVAVVLCVALYFLPWSYGWYLARVEFPRVRALGVAEGWGVFEYPEYVPISSEHIEQPYSVAVVKPSGPNHLVEVFYFSDGAVVEKEYIGGEETRTSLIARGNVIRSLPSIVGFIGMLAITVRKTARLRLRDGGLVWPKSSRSEKVAYAYCLLAFMCPIVFYFTGLWQPTLSVGGAP